MLFFIWLKTNERFVRISYMNQKSFGLNSDNKPVRQTNGASNI